MNGERDQGEPEQPTRGELKLPGHHAPRLEVLGEYAHADQTAGLQLLKVRHALAESGQPGAVLEALERIRVLLEAYRLGMAKEQRDRMAWESAPVTQRIKSRAKSRSKPSNRKKLRELYDQAQAGLESLKAQGFDALAWSESNQGEPGTQRTLTDLNAYETKQPPASE